MTFFLSLCSATVEVISKSKDKDKRGTNMELHGTVDVLEGPGTVLEQCDFS